MQKKQNLAHEFVNFTSGEEALRIQKELESEFTDLVRYSASLRFHFDCEDLKDPIYEMVIKAIAAQKLMARIANLPSSWYYAILANRFMHPVYYSRMGDSFYKMDHCTVACAMVIRVGNYTIVVTHDWDDYLPECVKEHGTLLHKENAYHFWHVPEWYSDSYNESGPRRFMD